MGNICGKQEPEDRLGPGRRLGSAPAPVSRASVPEKAKPKQTYQSEARVVGSGSSGSPGQSATPASQAARERWSAAEEDRKKQEAQRKKKTGARILTAKERDEQERRWREIDANNKQVQGQTS